MHDRYRYQLWVDYFNGVSNSKTDLLLFHERILYGDIILTEVLQGFRDDTTFRNARELLDALEFSPMLGRKNALLAAQNFGILRKAEIIVRKTIDVMVATFCIVNRHYLMHLDRDFDPMEKHLELRVLRP